MEEELQKLKFISSTVLTPSAMLEMEKQLAQVRASSANYAALLGKALFGQDVHAILIIKLFLRNYDLKITANQIFQGIYEAYMNHDISEAAQKGIMLGDYFSFEDWSKKHKHDYDAIFDKFEVWSLC